MTRILIGVFFLALSLSCKSDKRYHDNMPASSRQEAPVSKTYEGEIKRMRAEKDKTFSDPESSPLTPDDLEEFSGLEYFPVDSTYRVEARFEPVLTSPLVSMPTTTNREVKQRVYGVLYFTLNGRELELKVYQDPVLNSEPGYENYLFLPFTDLSNGEETYGGGRYLDLVFPEGDRLILDFNQAYNPYCAYNVKFSCPLVPRENHLEVDVKAGERAFATGTK